MSRSRRRASSEGSNNTAACQLVHGLTEAAAWPAPEGGGGK